MSALIVEDYIIRSFDDYNELFRILEDYIQEYKIVLLRAELGAGKTTLSQKFAKCLGVVEAVSSPTFSIVQEYDLEDGKLYHFDLYRIEDPIELEEIGFSDYLDSGHICFVEWPEIAAQYFDRYIGIKIHVESDERILSCVASH